MLVKNYPERFLIHQESQKKMKFFTKQSIQFVFDLNNFHESQKISNLWYEIKVRDGKSAEVKVVHTYFILKTQLESQIFNKLLS